MNTKSLALLLAATTVVAACKTEVDAAPAAEVVEPTPTNVQAKTAPKTAKRLKLDAAKSTVAFVGAKVTGSHRGTFEQPAGYVEMNGDDVIGLEIDIATKNLSIEPAKLQGHLKGPDFFDVEKYPKATFKLAKLTKGGSDGATHTVEGDLTMRGVTKRVSFPATVTIDAQAVGAKATFRIDRTQFGIVYKGMADDLIKNDVMLDIALRFSRNDEA